MYDKFSIYTPNDELTQKYGSALNADTLYLHSHRSPLAPIAMEWYKYDYQRLDTLAYRAYSLFAPNNTALNEFFNSYWKNSGYADYSSLDPLIQTLFLNEYVYSGSVAFPEEIVNGTVTTASGTKYNFDPYASDVNRKMCVNGSFYGLGKIQTPILCASSPEGARDYIVPSRKYKGKFYALPQAPQQYKQLLMVSGFDKYFQVAPCFRDEDARADRSPGEFYQLDFEMSFATQEDVFKIGEEVLSATFEKFAPEGSKVTKAPYPIISYKQAMLEFGSDKPDLRNPLRIIDVTEFFQRCTYKPFIGKTVRAIRVHAEMSKGFHEKLLKFATGIGMGGLGYLEVLEDGSYKGPIDKFIPDDMKEEFRKLAGLEVGDTIFFMADKEERAAYYAGMIRNELGEKLDLIEKDAYRFCYVNDFPMFERDPETKKIGFTHNPFSMPQGGLEALNTMNPLDILAYQYDIVCNGVELSSGAVRNHDMQIMEKAFEIAGYDKEVLKN